MTGMHKQRWRRQGDKNLPFACGKNVVDGWMAFAFTNLLWPAVAGGEQAAEAAVSLAVCRISQHFKTVGGDKPRADKQLDIAIFGLGISAHHTGERVAVSDADACQSEFNGGVDHFLRMRGAAQEREIGGDGELGI